MGFRIEISEPALSDAHEYVYYIREVKPKAAIRWFRGVVQAIYSLESQPQRCPMIPERVAFPFEIRHLIYHAHRIIFRIEKSEGRVIIYRVSHGSRRTLGVDDLPQPG